MILSPDRTQVNDCLVESIKIRRNKGQTAENLRLLSSEWMGDRIFCVSDGKQGDMGSEKAPADT
jgi:hypothetical protein